MNFMETSQVRRGTFAIIRPDNTFEICERKPTFDLIHKVLECELCDTVNLKNGCVMVVDDIGAPETIDGAPAGKNLPVNRLASAMVVACRKQPYMIYGSVVVVNDSDFE